MGTHAHATGISANDEQTVDRRCLRWLILTALAYYLRDTDAFATLPWQDAVTCGRRYLCGTRGLLFNTSIHEPWIYLLDHRI